MKALLRLKVTPIAVKRLDRVIDCRTVKHKGEDVPGPWEENDATRQVESKVHVSVRHLHAGEYVTFTHLHNQ